MKKFDVWMQTKCSQAILRWPILGIKANVIAKLLLIIAIAFLAITLAVEHALK